MKAALIGAAVLLTACGEPKKPAELPAPPAGVPAPPPDRIGAAPEPTVKPAGPAGTTKADTTKRAGPTTKGDDRLRDSAFGPKFTVDSTGKVRPVKKP